ncbi:pre-mRNA-splicing factor CWC22 homolog isoform X2 [Lepeophtheirus salmonis]|uniref:pre-mRNA-splicing factor CWC22 homolog isoform X2 n=1 Tax=Lepeophtheirus salmonis TaxID=72036 RepID=UPI001AE9F79E|nr:pre-mRNA-splicing factor CWC22 homolog isoform X2 [Lepeophtheirus salmonis]
MCILRSFLLSNAMTYLAREVINIIRISTDTYMQDCFSFHILVEYYIIYLTIQSSLDFEETVHKLMKMELKSGHEQELCHMVIDCFAQQRTYEKFYGLLAQRLCQLKKEYVEPFEKIFVDSYNTVHHLEIGKLRNVSKIFAHLLFTDAMSWQVLTCIHLNEHETTSSSRIFIKLLFQELAEYIGLKKLNARIRDPLLIQCFEGLFPRDDPVNTRFAINFFTSIGLGGLTEDLRLHLKSKPVTKKVSTSSRRNKFVFILLTSSLICCLLLS